MVEMIKHFGYYLYGKEFVAFTYHKPLYQLMPSDRLNGRLRRQGMKLQHGLVEICYVPGEKNGLADALSQEERKRRCETRLTQRTDVSLALGDVEGATSTTGREPRRETLKEVPQMKSRTTEQIAVIFVTYTLTLRSS